MAATVGKSLVAGAVVAAAAAMSRALAAGIIVGLSVLVLVNYRPWARPANGQEPALQALLFFYGETCYHIHHYMYMLPLAAALWSLKPGEAVVSGLTGFLIGASLETFVFYDDWYKIVNNCQSEQAVPILQGM